MQLIDNLKAVKAAGIQVKSYRMAETHRGVAWSCNVEFHGEKLGMVSNNGDGGITHFEFGPNYQASMFALLKNHGYKIDLTLGETTVDEPTEAQSWLEFVIPQIGDELRELKGYKRNAKKQIYVELEAESKVVYYKCEDTPANRANILALHTDPIQFLNDQFATL